MNVYDSFEVFVNTRQISILHYILKESEEDTAISEGI